MKKSGLILSKIIKQTACGICALSLILAATPARGEGKCLELSLRVAQAGDAPQPLVNACQNELDSTWKAMEEADNQDALDAAASIWQRQRILARQADASLQGRKVQDQLLNPLVNTRAAEDYRNLVYRQTRKIEEKSKAAAFEKAMLKDGKLDPDEQAVYKKTAQKTEAKIQDKAGKGEPVLPQEYTDVGKTYLKGGSPADAERMTDRSIKAKPDNPEAYSTRAAARLSQGNKEGALADAQKTLSMDPDNKAAQEIVGYLHAAPDLENKVKLRKPDFGSMLNADSSPQGSGAAQLRAGRADGPASGFVRDDKPLSSRVNALTPSQLLTRKAAGKMGLHDYTKALMYATQAIDADPDNAEAWALRAEISNRLKNYPAAVKDADQALKLDPRDAQALRARSNAEYELGDYQKAYEDADAAVKLEPNNAVGYLYRAMAEEKLGDVKNAALDYRRAETLDPSLKPLCDEALKQLGVRTEGGGTRVPKKMLLRGGTMLASLILVLMGLEGGRRVVTTIKRRKALSQAPLEKLPDGTIDSGTVLGGNFRVVGELGRGGMGVVYEAFDLTLQRRVAIKQLQRDETTTQEDFDRFLKEARLVAKLKHPNIAEIYSVIEDEDFYLVFEHVEGKTLDSILAKNGRLPLSEARRLLDGICEALDYAHGQKIIHRDLKPSNIMVCPDGSAKIMDFGIAHQSQSLSGQTLTSASGTPPYMAPEQGFGSASPAADIYALGVMTYEMLTGSRPFRGQDLMGDKLAERFPPASQAAPSLPPSIDGLFSAALKADPARRLASGEVFLKALDAASPAAKSV